MEVSGRRIAVPVWKDGRVVGQANAMLNLDRTLHSVLALARRDQGEIPFAIDQGGTLYTQDAVHRGTLEQLGIMESANAAANGSPRRVGDWMVVARKDAGGLVFGIARPIAESLREIRRMSLQNLSIGLAVIALACVGIVPISRRMTEHVSSLTAGVQQLAGGDFKARVRVRSSDEFSALAAAFNRMAEDLERHEAMAVEPDGPAMGGRPSSKPIPRNRNSSGFGTVVSSLILSFLPCLSEPSPERRLVARTVS